ncbi:DUF2796 domain-containing protein [Pseudorhodoferax sp. Leaf267]|uniref:ZrgA family zinc uptake protein n=1 Tax=Pseudorhodoferax sp. Leaf267 TaxID=1736316 RepID=UPI0006F9F8B9|nr:DUF2796 domain-containing protein [Pseudorhodoferax sp. Leaf267]KQP18041.1 hypothetical protein ASF43_09305 [Pseudorhodoferax sp. Leaf267]
MHRSFFAGLALSLLAAAAPAMAQGHAHSHGQLSLDVAVDAQDITVRLDAPLHDLVGFERAPRSVAERGRVTALLEQLKLADKLFVLDPAGGCKLGDVQIASAVLGLGSAPAPAKDEAAPEHADLDMTVTFACDKAAAARFIDVKLFDAFKGVRSVDAQVATAKGQSRVSLRRAASRLPLDGSAQ